jgi:hypothetical protein
VQDPVRKRAPYMVQELSWVRYIPLLHCPELSHHIGQLAFSVCTECTVSNAIRVNIRVEWHWAQACNRLKQAGVGTNGILRCMSKSGHYT